MFVNNEKIMVMGIGGAGNNEINRFIEKGMFQKEVEMVAVNTDRKALDLCKTKHKLLLGNDLFQGEGVHVDPELARHAAEESENQIIKMLEGVKLLFLICGMGGGTGTGATPIIAEIAKKMGVLTVALVTTPFKFEAKQRMDNAEKGIKNLTPYADTTIVMPNDFLLEVVSRRETMSEALDKCTMFWNIIIEFIQGASKDKSYDIFITLKEKGLAKFSYGVGSTLKEAVENALNQSWIKSKNDPINEVIYVVSQNAMNGEDSSILSSFGIPFHMGYQDVAGEDNKVLVTAILL